MDDDGEEIDWGFWEAVIQDSDQVALKLPHLLSLKLRSGIPSKVRGLMWQAMSKSASLHLETVYKQLCNEKSPHERVIQRDLSRTFPRIDMFKKENGQGQISMKRILEAYSLYDTEVGYCQGLAFLVGPLLMNMPEEQSFCVFVRLMETYEMRSMFTLNMEGLQVRLYQFSSLLKEILPDLTNHLDLLGVHPAMYASQWFLTLFAYAFPVPLVSRIYDIIFAEGAAETIMRVSIAILKRSQDTILSKVPAEFEHILDFLTSQKLCEPYKDFYSQVIHDAMALSGIITREKMDILGEEYAQQTAEGKVIIPARKLGFWKRKKQLYSAKNNKIFRSYSGAFTTAKASNKKPTATNPPLLKKRWSSVSSPKEWIYLQKTPNCDRNETNDIEKKLKCVLHDFDQLKIKHQKTLDELNEVNYDKEDLECERDALKLTIAELERYQQISYNCDSSAILSSTSFSNLEIAQNAAMAENVYLQETKAAKDNQDISLQLVHLKVHNFELEQHCENLEQDLELIQAKLDMVNEGQIALVDKLVVMKTELEEARIEKSHIKEENERLKKELTRLKEVQLLAPQNEGHCGPCIKRRHSTSSIIPGTNNKQLYELEPSLIARKMKLDEYASTEKRKASIYGRVLHAFSRSS
ncbi:rab-GTPase-TBC domain-containing protein [Gilbertella persicaria]|uniref:rab-GTPase-TBC domain-containing protein n=1 Tax=Gilbertella persicaria TaxID=101096 RepID=UPI00221FA216|nr:rab-GTPase-TBC domain-containing protein [Gilbertella persicaria]KAI8058675.1 rab-GTPase-TBC domain-containing protein [Gilbertella persicaria]